MADRASPEFLFALRVTEPGRGAREVRGRGALTVGRSRKNDLVLDDPRVSLKHLAIDVEQGAVRVRDLATTNGTWLLRAGTAVAPSAVSGTVVLHQGDELRLGDPDGTRVELTVEPLVVEAVPEREDQLKDPRLARVLARVDVEGIVGALAAVVLDTFPEVENVLVWGMEDEAPLYGARRTKLGVERLGEAPPFSRTVIQSVRGGAGTVVFGTASPTIDSESLRNARILAGFCAPLVDAQGRVVGVIEADSRSRNWTPDPATLREVTTVARFAGRVAAVVLEAEALKRKADALAREGDRLRAELGSRAGLQGIIGRDASVRSQIDLVTRVAPLDAPVLITGETGTGKELFARGVHESSPRQKGPFVAINCASLTATLLESELFGYERGAFTGAERSTPGLFERAHGGTLFLDEIGDAPLDLQAAMLRAIELREIRRLGSRETRRVDVRIIAATHRDLTSDVAAGRFRRDLLYRMNAFHLRLPALRERRADIPELVTHFLGALRTRLQRPELRVAADGMQVLLDDPWIGNVRELENRLLRAAVLTDDGVIRAEHVLPVEAPPAPAAQAPAPAPGAPTPAPSSRAATGRSPSLREARDSFLREQVTRALETTGGNKREAARILGMDASNLARTMKRLGLMGSPSSPFPEDE